MIGPFTMGKDVALHVFVNPAQCVERSLDKDPKPLAMTFSELKCMLQKFRIYLLTHVL